MEIIISINHEPSGEMKKPDDKKVPYTISKSKKGGYLVKKKEGGKVVAGNKTKLSHDKAAAVIGAIEHSEKK